MAQNADKEMTRHEWDRNSPMKGWATCSRCGLPVKTYKIRKGGLPKCLGIQRRLFKRPPCAALRPVQACFICPGRHREDICDQLRSLLKNDFFPETPLSPIPA